MKTTGLAVTTTASTSTAGTTVAGNATSTSTLVHEVNHSGPDSQATLSISGATFTSAAPVVDKLMDGGTVWINVALVDEKTFTNSAAPSPTDSVTSSYRFSCAGAKLVRAYCTAGTLTTCRLEITTGTTAEFGGERSVLNQTVTATGATLVNVSSATAFVVGPNGTTNPTFQVVTNVASEATGLKITGAAAAAGVALAVISSGTNESLTVDAKAAGVVALGDTSTGTVYVNRGALKALQVGLTLTALGTAQSSTPTSAQLLGGFLTQTGATGAGTITLPTGTALSTACARTPAVGDSFECVFANLGGGQTLTVTGATGTTVVSGAAIATAKSATLKFILTSANAWSIAVIGG